MNHNAERAPKSSRIESPYVILNRVQMSLLESLPVNSSVLISEINPRTTTNTNEFRGIVVRQWNGRNVVLRLHSDSSVIDVPSFRYVITSVQEL